MHENQFSSDDNSEFFLILQKILRDVETFYKVVVAIWLKYQMLCNF